MFLWDGHAAPHPTKETDMPAYFDTGFCVRKPSWHGEELLLDDYPIDWADARVKAGLTWEPQAEPYYRKNGDLYVPVPGRQIITRSDSGLVLGETSDSFELFTHESMGSLMEAFLGARSTLKFETAGSVNEGRHVWALAYLDEPFTVGGDDGPTYPFLALLNNHDGTGAVKATYTSIRVVCWNTYSMASIEGERTGAQHVFRHTTGLNDRVEEAKKAIVEMEHEAEAWKALADELFAIKLDDEEEALRHFMFDFPGLASPREHGKPTSDRVEENVGRARNVFRSLYLDSITNAPNRGTALGLVDTAVEYLDHVRGFRNQDTYLNRTILRPEPLKALAVRQARKVAGK